jgi:hypothetical protein
VLALSYFFLARRSGRQLEAIFKRAVKEFEGGRVEQGRRIFEEGFALARWQFLIAAQIHAQLGSIDYLQQNFKAARKHLEKAWSRNWQAQAMLAAIDHREGNNAAALERLEKLKSAGAKEAVYWGLFAYIATEAGRRGQGPAGARPRSAAAADVGLAEEHGQPGAQQEEGEDEALRARVVPVLPRRHARRRAR